MLRKANNMKRERSDIDKRLVITDTDLISGIKYAGKNLDLNTQRGEVGEAGRRVGVGRNRATRARVKDRMSLSSKRGHEASWPTREDSTESGLQGQINVLWYHDSVYSTHRL